MAECIAVLVAKNPHWLSTICLRHGYGSSESVTATDARLFAAAA
jgi:hypothetical protein